MSPASTSSGSPTGGTEAGRLGRALVALALLGTLVPGSAQAEQLPGPGTSREQLPRRVLVVSVDGLGSAAPEQAGLDTFPTLRRLADEGAGTLEARTAYERTLTLPNHTGMLTGRRVLGARGHHVDVNVDPGGTVHDRAGRYVPSFFDVVHDHGGATALFTSKDKFVLFDRTWSDAGAPDTVGTDDGRDKIDRFVYRQNQKRLVRQVVRRLRGRAPDGAVFLHLALPDRVGHARGYLSPAYFDAVRVSDRQVGRILDTVAADPQLAATTTVVLTADHGGQGPHHRDPAAPVNYRIPFFVWGAGVAEGADLYALNPERTDPGEGRPKYRESPPIRNTDVAGVVTSLLGLPRVKGGRLRGTTPLEVS